MGCAAIAFAAVFMGVGTPASAQKVSAKSDTPPVRALAGVSVQYEEKASSHLLYLEQKGGMVSPLPPPVPANVPEPTPALSVAPKSQSAVVPSKKAARKAAT